METEITKPQSQPQVKGVIITGYCCAILSILILPILFMPISIIFGLICLGYNKAGHGIFIILLSVILGLKGASDGGWGFGLPKFHLSSINHNADSEHNQYTLYFKDKNRQPEGAFDLDVPSDIKFGDTITYTPFGTFDKSYVLKSDLDSIVKTGTLKLDGVKYGTCFKFN